MQKAFALSGRHSCMNITQGVALGLVLLPFQGDIKSMLSTQGVALGLVLLPLRGDIKSMLSTQGVALGLVLLPFQGALNPCYLPRALPWAWCFCPFGAYWSIPTVQAEKKRVIRA